MFQLVIGGGGGGGGGIEFLLQKVYCEISLSQIRSFAAVNSANFVPRMSTYLFSHYLCCALVSDPIISPYSLALQ